MRTFRKTLEQTTTPNFTAETLIKFGKRDQVILLTETMFHSTLQFIESQNEILGSYWKVLLYSYSTSGKTHGASKVE